MKSARSVLLLKEGAIRIEIHANEGPISSYLGKPLVVISTDDLKVCCSAHLEKKTWQQSAQTTWV